MTLIISRDYHEEVLNTMKNFSRHNQWWSTGINLGGTAGASGGAGAPPGGVFGQLPQTKVAYDTTEAAYLGIQTNTPSGSLYDNLAHIRYRLDIIETSGIATSSGLVKVSADDTVADYLENKIVAGSGISIATLNPGADEDLEITATLSGGGATTLGELTDVTISSPADNEILAYDNGTSEWINQTAAEASLSEVGHTHTESDITDLSHYTSSDFDTDFSGKSTTDLSEGTNLYFTDERVDDRVNNLLIGEGTVSLTYDDVANTLTISGASSAGSGQLTEEEVQDFAWNVLTGTQTLITVTYDDANNEVDFVVDEASIDHDALTNFVAAEHIDWTVTGAEDIHDDRIAQSSVTQHESAITITESQISDLAHYTSSDFDTDFGGKSTTDLSEGTNLYFTDERVDDRVNNLLIGGNNISLTYDDVGNSLTISGVDTDTSTFLGLSDTPSTYSGEAGNFPYAGLGGVDELLFTDNFKLTGFSPGFPPSKMELNSGPFDMNFVIASSGYTALFEVDPANELVDIAAGDYVTFADFQTTFNGDQSSTRDIVFRGSNVTNLLHLDVGNDRVGIKTNAPSDDVHIAPLDANSTTNFRVEGGGSITGGTVAGLFLYHGSTLAAQWKLDAGGTMQFQVENQGSFPYIDFNAPGGGIRFWPKATKVAEFLDTGAEFPEGIRLNDDKAYFRSGTDTNHGVGWNNTDPDGPSIWGATGVKFATGSDGATIQGSISTSGMVIGSPTGGGKGSGTINATAVYDDDTLLTDFVFESSYEMNSIPEMREFYETNKHLPTIPGRDTWEEEGGFSLGKLTTHLWETVEVQARYIADLEKRISKLEEKTNDIK